MSRRLAVTTTTLLVAALAIAPAHAGGLNGSYKVNLTPDPTLEATGQVSDGCDAAVNPAAVDNHELKVPGPGTLTVVLDAPDPVNSGQTDWDLWVLDADGAINTGSHGESAHEEVSIKYKKAEKATIQVCNLAGAPQGTVTYSFVPAKKKK